MSICLKSIRFRMLWLDTNGNIYWCLLDINNIYKAHIDSSICFFFNENKSIIYLYALFIAICLAWYDTAKFF